MLQRQIMFKQLQELQRRQQLQELGDARNQDYVDQLSSLKQASALHFAPTVNGAPVHDSQMFTVGNMQMIQHGGSSIFQGFPNGLVLSQSHNQALGPMGLSQPQSDISLYGTPAPNTDKNLNLYSHLQGPSDHSVNLLTKNNHSPLGMSAMHSSAFASPIMSQQGNFSSDQISMPDGSLLPNQVFQEKNLFGQVPVQSLNSDLLSVNYSQQGITMQRNTSLLESEGRHEDSGWHGISPGKVSKVGMSQPAASLDPLEQKILYNTDDNSWESSFGRSSKMGTGGFECTSENPSYMDAFPSIQSGSWSALMQSAVTETSSSDTVIQEEWSGLSFQNPEPSSDNQPSNFINSEKPQNNWVDRNLQNVSSPSSEPEQLLQKSNMNYSFPGFQQSGHQYKKEKDEFQSKSSHASGQHSPRNTSQLADYNSQLKQPTGGSQLLQTSLPSPNTWPAQYKEILKNGHQPNDLSCKNDKKPCINFSGHELRGTLWLHGSASNSVSGGIQMPYDQVNQLNIHRYSVQSEKMAPGNNVEPMSALLGASSDLHGQNVTAQSENMLELLNKDDISNDPTPGMQLNSKVSSLNELPLTETSVASIAKPCNNNHLESQGFDFRVEPADAGTPQSYSFFPSFSMGNSSATSLPSHYVNDYIKNQRPAPPVPSHMSTKLPAYSAASSQVNFLLKSGNSGGPEFPLLENVAVTQPLEASVVSQHSEFPTGLPTPWPDITTRQDVSSPKPYQFSSRMFRSPDSASSSVETSSGAPIEQPNQNCFKPEHNVLEFGTCSGKSRYREQRLEKESSLHEGSTEIHNPTSLSRSTHTQESLRKHNSEADGVASGSLMTHTSQRPYNHAEQKDDKTPAVPARDIRAFGQSLHQNYSLLHQLHSPRNAETDCGKRLPLKYDSIDYQQAIANARELLLSGQKSVVKDKAKGDLHAVQLGAFSSGDNKGWNFSQEAQEDQSAKASSAAYLHNFQQTEMLGQNDTQSRFIGSNEASNVAYQSQISLQMAPSWFKHNGTLKNGQVLPMYNPKAAINAAQPFSGLSIGNLQENSLIMQVKSANASQGSGVWPSSAATSIASKHLSPPSMLPSDVTYQNLAVSTPKKRKIVAYDMVPWHKEVNHEALRLQNISMAVLEWAQASNRRQEEAKNEAEIVEDVLPVVRAKRRLIFTTQLMQQVFRPAPAVILFADASSNCDYVAYFAARLALGDACNLTSKLPSDTNDVSHDKLKVSKRISACDFSKVVKGLISRVEKLESDLSRLDRNLSIVDIKVESQELEKFSTINRFAKFHMKAHQSTVHHPSSSGPSTVQKTSPQRYVIPLPMPRTLPEGTDCLSL